jgi:hypothetical protein
MYGCCLVLSKPYTAGTSTATWKPNLASHKIRGCAGRNRQSDAHDLNTRLNIRTHHRLRLSLPITIAEHSRQVPARQAPSQLSHSTITQLRHLVVRHGKSPQTRGTWRGIAAPVRSSATCSTGGCAMEENADHSAISSSLWATLLQQYAIDQYIIPETGHVCYAESDHCVCAMCTVVHLGGDDYNSVAMRLHCCCRLAQ